MNLVAALDDFILSNNIATEEEIRLVTQINGYNEETMYDIIYARTSYRSYEQCVSDNEFISTDELNEYYGLNEEEEEGEE